MDFIPTDSEDEEGNESDGNLDDLYPGKLQMRRDSVMRLVVWGLG